MRLRRLGDLLIPLGTALLLAMSVLDEGRESLGSPGVLVGIAVSLGQGAALYWRRSRPELVTAIAAAGGAVVLILAPELVLPLAGLFALGSLAAARPPRVSVVGLVGVLAVAAINFVTTTAGDAAFAMVVVGGAWALGEAARNRRAAIEEETLRAVGEEQARIARELHDVIAHSVSVIVVQAAAADDVFEERPDQAREALRSIERSGREALGELRRLLSGVRPGEGAAPPAPQPGLDRLEELAEPLRSGGLEVVVEREGPVAALPAGVELSAYRIVQEALTNTLRHGRATRAAVSVRYGDDTVELEVRDDGRGAAASAADGGHGLMGMRERAAMLGGSLEAGPMPRGGYRVLARLPRSSPG
jgi:signal transduction histidine kinase